MFAIHHRRAAVPSLVLRRPKRRTTRSTPRCAPTSRCGLLSISAVLLMANHAYHSQHANYWPRDPQGSWGDILLHQDSRPSSGSGGVFKIIRRDPETVLVHPTTTQIPGRIIRTGTEGLRLLGLLLTVRAQYVLSPCAVTQSRRSHFPDPYLIQNGVTNISSH